jgi:hypothetical protein
MLKIIIDVHFLGLALNKNIKNIYIKPFKNKILIDLNQEFYAIFSKKLKNIIQNEKNLKTCKKILVHNI